MALTLSQIRAFRCIVRRGTFAAAARDLGVTPPSISQRIRELESALGVQLFLRHGPRVRLTSHGEALVPYAERLFTCAEDVVQHFHRNDPLSGLLRLGVTDSFAMVALPDLQRRLAELHPRLKTSVRVGDANSSLSLLNDCEVDVAVGPLTDAGPHIHQEPLGRNLLAWFAVPQFGISPGVISAQELVAHHLMCAGPTSRLYRTAMTWFAQSGVEPERLSTCNSLDVTLRAVLSGHVIGLLPVGVMRQHFAQEKVRRLTVTPPFPSLEFTICYQSSAWSPGIQAVLDISRQVVASYELYA